MNWLCIYVLDEEMKKWRFVSTRIKEQFAILFYRNLFLFLDSCPYICKFALSVALDSEDFQNERTYSSYFENKMEKAQNFTGSFLRDYKILMGPWSRYLYFFAALMQFTPPFLKPKIRNFRNFIFLLIITKSGKDFGWFLTLSKPIM